jgi:transposase-like protein
MRSWTKRTSVLADVVAIAQEAIFSAASLGWATVHSPAKAKVSEVFRRCRNGCWEQGDLRSYRSPPMSGASSTARNIEALHCEVRKTIKTSGHFPAKDAARKSFASQSSMPSGSCKGLQLDLSPNRLQDHFGERLP